MASTFPIPEPAPPGRRRPAGVRADVAALAASPIREVAALGEGRAGVIPLWYGESDQPTPAVVVEAAVDALRRGRTFYTPNHGIPELRAALAEYGARLHGRPPGPDRITVTASGMNALMLLMQALVEDGERVVVVDPIWPNINAAIRIVGGEPRHVSLEPTPEGGWRLDTDRLLAAIADDARVKAVFVNSPNNPTGWTMPRDDLDALVAFCRGRGVWLIADEVYNRIVYDGGRAPSVLDTAEPDDPVIAVNSFSKTWAMTGWRLGWITAPPRLYATLGKLNEFNVAAPTSFAQHGGVAAIRQGEPFVAAMLERLGRARAVVAERLAALPRVRLAPPAASFYAFFAVDGMACGGDSVAFAKEILRRTGVGLAPGDAFGPAGAGRLRLCFAVEPATLEAALERLAPLLRGG